jgi:hypothetical protein
MATATMLRSLFTLSGETDMLRDHVSTNYGYGPVLAERVVEKATSTVKWT